MTRNRILATVAVAAIGMTMARPAGATPPAGRPVKGSFEATYPMASPLGKWAGHEADAAMDLAGTDPAAAAAKVETAFVTLARFGQGRDGDAVREVAADRRLLHGIAAAPAEGRADLLAFLRANPPLAHAVAFAVGDRPQPAAAFALLDRLRRERPKQAAEYPELTAAVCAVRDRPLSRHLNENKVTAVDPVAIFDFFVAHDRRLMYGLKGVPVELLSYVVDTTASVRELTWAFDKYAGNPDVGKLFFTIRYDTAYFEGQSEKKVDHAAGGYTLPNILADGGVCIDQAYFAVTVGKAIGVPTAIATASSAEAGHAWVGFLRASRDGRTAAWDFNSGRYPEYQGLRGDVADPDTGHTIADSTVSLLGDMIGTTAAARQTEAAWVDAAVALGDDTGGPPPPYPDGIAKGKPPAPRATTDAQLDLIQLGLKQFSADPRAWGGVAALAKAGKLSLSQKKQLAGQVQQLCGQRHPDFAIAVLTPMVETVDDPAEQSRLWDGAFALVRARPDLAAEVRFRQADLWEQHHDLPKAGSAYAEVVADYLNAGPFAVKALAGAASVLHEMGRDRDVLTLYADAAKRVAKPSDGGRAEFVHQSNWYKIRQAYAERLAAAGQTAAAAQVRAGN